MLRAENLAYGPPGLPALVRQLSLALRGGEVLHIEGTNGSGKSLLARTLLGLHPASAGAIENTFSGFRYLPQMQNKASHLPFSLRDVIGPQQELFGLLSPRHLALAWNQASGGERQRALLAQFFSTSEPLLVLDEPWNHLDKNAKGQVKKLLRQLLADPRRAVVLISHEDHPEEWLPGIVIHKINLDRIS